MNGNPLKIDVQRLSKQAVEANHATQVGQLEHALRVVIGTAQRRLQAIINQAAARGYVRVG